MKNFIQTGDVVPVTAPAGGVVSGNGVIIGSLFGVADHSAAEGAPVQLATRGVFDLPKTSAQAWTLGAKVYWDAGNGVATTTASGNSLIGVALAAAANPSAVGSVRLNGVAV